METTYTIEQVIDAKKNTNGVSFAQSAKNHGVEKGSAAYREHQKRYDKWCKVYRWAASQSADENETTRTRTSLTNPHKHRITKTSGAAEGSILHKVLEEERREKLDLFRKSQIPFVGTFIPQIAPGESGLTDAEYITLAKHDGRIPINGYTVRNDNGRLVHTKDTCQRWLNDVTANVIAERQRLADIALASMQQSTGEQVTTKPKKSKAA